MSIDGWRVDHMIHTVRADQLAVGIQGIVRNPKSWRSGAERAMDTHVPFGTTSSARMGLV